MPRDWLGHAHATTASPSANPVEHAHDCYYRPRRSQAIPAAIPINIDPTLFRWEGLPLQITWHGFFTAVGTLVGGVHDGIRQMFMIIEHATPDKAVDALKQYGGNVIRTSLSDEDTKKLQDALTPQEPVGTTPQS